MYFGTSCTVRWIKIVFPIKKILVPNVMQTKLINLLSSRTSELGLMYMYSWLYNCKFELEKDKTYRYIVLLMLLLFWFLLLLMIYYYYYWLIDYVMFVRYTDLFQIMVNSLKDIDIIHVLVFDGSVPLIKRRNRRRWYVISFLPYF